VRAFICSKADGNLLERNPDQQGEEKNIIKLYYEVLDS
jgi:hypothetical protein